MGFTVNLSHLEPSPPSRATGRVSPLKPFRSRTHLSHCVASDASAERRASQAGQAAGPHSSNGMCGSDQKVDHDVCVACSGNASYINIDAAVETSQPTVDIPKPVPSLHDSSCSQQASSGLVSCNQVASNPGRPPIALLVGTANVLTLDPAQDRDGAFYGIGGTGRALLLQELFCISGYHFVGIPSH